VPWNSVNAIVDRLIADILQHFCDEEAVIVAAGFPAAAEHIVLHRALVDQALKLLNDIPHRHEGGRRRVPVSGL
jgi:hemerythrin